MTKEAYRKKSLFGFTVLGVRVHWDTETEWQKPKAGNSWLQKQAQSPGCTGSVFSF